MFLDFLQEQVSVDLRFHGQESLSETSRESRSGLLDTDLGAGDLGSVAGVEMVDSLFRGQFRYRGEH